MNEEKDLDRTPPDPGDIEIEFEGDMASTEVEPFQGGQVISSDDAIHEELARVQQEFDRLREMYLRKLADFDNYRKRQDREMAEFRKFANADLMRECLPVMDNLERALGAPSSDASGLREGVELVLKQLKDALARFGLIEVDPLGAAFDPQLHEAIQRRESAEVDEATVLQVLQKGYLIGERLLRPALVIVAVPARDDGANAGDGAVGGES